MFEKFNLTFDSNSFGILYKSAIFENITRGRLGTTLIDDINGTIPLVRTTTKYNKPAQSFQKIHYDIINNALIFHHYHYYHHYYHQQLLVLKLYFTKFVTNAEIFTKKNNNFI